MQIKGTQKLGKKTLDLYSIKLQIQSSKTLPINDSDFYNSDVQIAHKMGLIEVVGDVPAINTGLLAEKIEDTEERMIKCKNIHARSIASN